MADRARGIPIEPDTIFDIGSVAKQFTAAAILRLEEMGRLRTSDLLSAHFRGVPADKQRITIHHLLTHTSGLSHDVGEVLSRPSRDEAVRDILATPLRTPPGEKYAYSNAGYALLAAIIEQASGREYETFLRQELWLPAGMSQTGMQLGGLDHAPVAESYAFDGQLPPTLFHRPDWGRRPSWRVLGAGYVLSTLIELGRWGEALRTGRVLSDSSRRKLFRPHVREDGAEPSYYGYGWAISASSDGSCRIGHNGSAGHQFDVMSFFPERDAVYIAFTTQQRSPWRNFPNNGYAPLLARPISLPPVAVRPAQELAILAGDYRLPDGSELPVRLQQGRLHIEVLNGQTMRLFSPWPMLGPDQTAPLGDRQALISTVMDAIARRDYGPLLSRLRTGVDQAEERQWWEDRWPRWISERGRYLGTQLAGTIVMESSPRFPVDPGDRLRTLAIVRFERGSALMGFVHDPDGRIYIDWMQASAMRNIFLAPQEDGGFLAYSPITRRTVEVRFETERNSRTMRIGQGGETARAVALNRREGPQLRNR
jgi:CubicO group peptidase (beta-lactamase class C family)